MDAARALIRDPEWVDGYKWRGMAYFHIQKYREAFKDLSQYKRLKGELEETEESRNTSDSQRLQRQFLILDCPHGQRFIKHINYLDFISVISGLNFS